MTRGGGKESRFSKKVKSGCSGIMGRSRRKSRVAASPPPKHTVAGRPKSALMRMPLEIRELIWRWTIGNMHLTFVNAKVTNWGTTTDVARLCISGWESENDDYNKKWHFVNLLLASRQVYNEALPFVYQTNIFQFQSLKAMETLEAAPGIKWDMIRAITLNWGFLVRHRPRPNVTNPNFWDPFHWLMSCAAVSRLQALKTIRVIMDDDMCTTFTVGDIVGDLKLLRLQKHAVQVVMLYSTFYTPKGLKDTFDHIYRIFTEALTQRKVGWCLSGTVVNERERDLQLLFVPQRPFFLGGYYPY